MMSSPDEVTTTLTTFCNTNNSAVSRASYYFMVLTNINKHQYPPPVDHFPPLRLLLSSNLFLRRMNSEANEDTCGVDPRTSRMYSRISELDDNVMQKDTRVKSELPLILRICSNDQAFIPGSNWAPALRPSLPLESFFWSCAPPQNTCPAAAAFAGIPTPLLREPSVHPALDPWREL